MSSINLTKDLMMPTSTTQEKPFEAAIEAIINGDVDSLKTLLSQNPNLVQERSSSEHHATLIHYVSANGVEDEKQRTPENILDIAKILLGAGANPEAVADIYGGSDALSLLISSSHPAQAGKQADLVRLFCQHGANPNGINDDGQLLILALSSRHLEAAQALVESGARVDNPIVAAGLGYFDVLQDMMSKPLQTIKDANGNEVSEEDDIKAYAFVTACMAGEREIVEYFVDDGIDINLQAGAEQNTGLHEAAQCNHLGIAQFLLDKDADTNIQNNNGQTALHLAAWNLHTKMVKLLLEHDAALEVVNNWGGTVLDSTVWAIANQHYPPNGWQETLTALINAGADVSKVSPYPTGREDLDNYLAAYMG